MADHDPKLDPKDPLHRKGGDPYCGNCGYHLAGATESARCPECGKPIVEVLVRQRSSVNGKSRRFRSGATFMGLPVVDIALGPRHDLNEGYGKARGIIAVGDVATGGIAIGGRAFGVVAIGGLAVGGFTLGGMSVGLGAATGGGAIGGLASGGGAIGGLASGGGAFGFMAQGGGAVGYFIKGGGGVGVHAALVGGGGDPKAEQAFDAMAWYFGGNNIGIMLQPLIVNIGFMVLASLVIVIVAGLLKRTPRDGLR